MNMTERWDLVRETLPDARLIAWDECHKIYVAIDDAQADWFRESGYTLMEGTPDEMFDTLVKWFDASCWLRFIDAVRLTAPDPNDGYIGLIPQFADEGE